MERCYSSILSLPLYRRGSSCNLAHKLLGNILIDYTTIKGTIKYTLFNIIDLIKVVNTLYSPKLLIRVLSSSLIFSISLGSLIIYLIPYNIY